MNQDDQLVSLMSSLKIDKEGNCSIKFKNNHEAKQNTTMTFVNSEGTAKIQWTGSKWRVIDSSFSLKELEDLIDTMEDELFW
jgi:hypothetical protein